MEESDTGPVIRKSRGNCHPESSRSEGEGEGGGGGGCLLTARIAPAPGPFAHAAAWHLKFRILARPRGIRAGSARRAFASLFSPSGELVPSPHYCALVISTRSSTTESAVVTPG